MGLLISINGADFEPYYSVTVPDPLITGPRKAKSVQGVQGRGEHHSEFEKELKKSSGPGYLKYEKTQSNSRARQLPPRRAIKAKELMSSPVITLREENSLEAARDLLLEKGIRHLPIVNESKVIVGIISDRDLSLSWVEKTIGEVMSRTLVAARLDTSLQEIARAMVDHRISSVPVLDEERHVVGILTSSDIMTSVFKNPNIDLFI